jgi:hypothetical protein
MNESYTILAYCIALGLLLGYAFYLWVEDRVVTRKYNKIAGGRP